MKRWSGALYLVVLWVAFGSGCAVRHVERQSMERDLRDVVADVEVLPPFPEPPPASGSLWAPGGASLVRDPKAFRINDLLTVVLNERSIGTTESNTDLNRSSESDFGASVLFGLEDDNPQTGSFNVNNAFKAGSASKFSGDGTTARSTTLSGTITTRVMRVLPNGDLVVAGQKNVIVNRERQVLTLVGSVRSVDVGSDNRVASSIVGDLTVRLWGRGEIDTTTRQGWFQKMMHHFWPF